MTSKKDSFQNTILDSVADGVFTVDLNWKITSFNKSAESIIGISRNNAIGRPCKIIFKADTCDNNCLLKHTLQTGKQFVNKKVTIVNSIGEKVPISISTALLKNPSGKIIGGVETFRDISVIEELRKEILGHHTFADIITKDHIMLKIFEILPTLSKSESTILITGDSGTGKELMAHAIHNLSKRVNGPFITVNCGALPDNLLESELFGYKKGAFTDAKTNKPGKFKLANGGTLFLDEIGDISKAMQVKLLRVLQEKEYDPLGSIKPEKADVRIITATNQDLSKLVNEKKFRKDLFYRINVLNIHLPPLNKRKGDIPLLIEQFIAHFNSIYEKNIIDVDRDVLRILMKYEFPGNIRELRNCIEHSCIMCTTSTITEEHLPQLYSYIDKDTIDDAVSKTRNNTVHDFERAQIESALEENKYNRQKTAQVLGMHPTTLWRKMKKYGIE